MRLIDADRLSEAIYDNVPAPYEEAVWAKEDCLAEIEAAQTVDAVEVVRCKDCKYKRLTRGSIDVKSYSCNCGNSPCRGRIVEPSFFCFYGERKEDETD